MNRLGICIFYDEQGIVDDYMLYLLAKVSEYTSRLIFVSNGDILSRCATAIEALGCELRVRENVGFDVFAYKDGLESVGYENLAAFDEILLLNHTFYGPLFPLSELFDEMDSRQCDFWGITAHKEVTPNPFTNEGVLPRHFNSHFIAVRSQMAASPEFRDYWETMPEIESYVDSVLKHESRFTQHFEKLGFVSSIYDDDRDYGTAYPCFFEVDDAIWRRCPILKRRLFFHDSLFLESIAVDLPRALDTMRKTSDYDEGLIWRNIVRTANLRTLGTNAALYSVIPEARSKSWYQRTSVAKIAVCAHIYYVDLLPELLSYAKNIPGKFDFIATTDSEEKRQEVERILGDCAYIENVTVRIVEENRGRDMSALFITCRDLFLDDRYDMVCRLHTKKSPQVEQPRSNLFKRHLLENLLSSRGFVENLLDLCDERPWIGLLVPPVVHISYPTMGRGWFSNKPKAIEVAKMLGLHVKFDEDTPVAAYGTMFWFRPAALRKLFAHKWKWVDFNAEPNHYDGGLAHALERIIAYCAQDARYTTQQVFSCEQAGLNYAMLEIKYQAVSASIPAMSSPEQRQFVAQWKDADYPLERVKPRDEVAERVALEFGQERKRWRDPFVDGLIANRQRLRSNSQSELLNEDNLLLVEQFMLDAGKFAWSSSVGSSLRRAVVEYLSIGWASGRDLLTLFDSDYYLGQNPDVAGSGENPLVHFIKYGREQQLSPHPLFDMAYYLRKSSSAQRLQINPLLCFLKSTDKVSPHPLFDMDYYSTHSPEVARAGLNLLVHYIRHGGVESRDPHPLFSAEYYYKNSSALKNAGINPLIHYVSVGYAMGLNPHPLFDVRYYMDRYPEVAAESLDPLVDFLEQSKINSAGDLEFRDPSPNFSSSAYLQSNPDVAAAGANPLVHYVVFGKKEGRRVVVVSRSAVGISRV